MNKWAILDVLTDCTTQSSVNFSIVNDRITTVTFNVMVYFRFLRYLVYEHRIIGLSRRWHLSWGHFKHRQRSFTTSAPSWQLGPFKITVQESGVLICHQICWSFNVLRCAIYFSLFSEVKKSHWLKRVLE